MTAEERYDRLAYGGAVADLLHSRRGDSEEVGATAVARFVAEQEMRGVVKWKHEDEMGGVAVGPIGLTAATPAQEATGEVGRPYDPRNEQVWFSRLQAEWIADELGARFEES